MKDFKQEFYKIYNLLRDGEPFSFIRFSDGELFMLKNQEVRLGINDYVTGSVSGPGIYTSEEQKHFLPDRDWFYRDELIESLKHFQPNYFKGICSRTDVPEEDFLLQKKLAGSDDETYLTFANLFINSNYPLFMNNIVKYLSTTWRPIAMVLNEKCDTSKLPFKVAQEFRIGTNCLVNNYNTIKEVQTFLQGKKDWIVLCSAASLSNLIGYYCFSENPNNTIIDIGSTLNPILGLEGWKYSRDYLRHYWMGQQSSYCLREEKW